MKTKKSRLSRWEIKIIPLHKLNKKQAYAKQLLKKSCQKINHLKVRQKQNQYAKKVEYKKNSKGVNKNSKGDNDGYRLISFIFKSR